MHLRKGLAIQTLPSGRGYLFDSLTGYIFRLNKTARVFASLMLAEDLNLDELLARVEEAFEVSASDTPRPDLVSFIDQLQHYRLLEG